ncbi:Cysteine-rich [Glarea lozoyensis ATCC 20868]|uniref:Cysteine-rich n=1 Tax=Glarea lozoyensis (strain ATCC 20868 / MF5171) TaxID=1116229 RepID=S3DY68_GLAL2|nr:Cysteine-rich [Glarea lozoyensis ATCC 20868]EPE36856.1 Cysteine-rich [Glarea lozoyensis ATCC 20868]
MDTTSAPLADYFWIAGIDSLSYSDPVSWSQNTAHQTNLPVNPPSPSFDATIEEGGESEGDTPTTSPTSKENRTPRAQARHSRQNSWNRLSKLTNDSRNSIGALEELDNTSRSNRSSITVKGVPASNGTNGSSNGNSNGASGGLLGDFDFDSALIKFAHEREHFLDDLSFSAGAPPQRPNGSSAIRSPTVKIADVANGQSTKRNQLKSVGGSIRRRISFRDMNSMKRQPTTTQAKRTSSVRTSKRMSNYNSVIPPPEPLNADPEMHPLKRRFEPVLLDRYPPKSATDELKRRGRFPDYVPMFAFPNDILIMSGDERPRSTWHGFTMTSDDNSKIYGITVIVWMPLNQDAAADIERRCELWRQNHMSDEERELAVSLGGRLAGERAKLSQLLAKLPSVVSGSDAREALEDEISAVEEKIALMTDMLRPVRHGAASKIDGLTDGDTGLWTPRAYGILGRDPSMTSFWKEWLRAVVVPMTDGGVLRIPPSSPKIGRWQPLERYVVNLCTEALSPISSKTQVELAVRELRMFARKEAANELPESRNTDLYALFRALTIPNIVTLFECALAESRIILLSSHTAMLYLASKALASLLYPLKWASIFIPVLPARLISALEAPCPYIVGVERRYENLEWPEDDVVLVDLDQDDIMLSAPVTELPRQQRRKLISLLQLAAPHHNRCGVPVGPPAYAVETFPYDAFSSENEAIFTQKAQPSSLSKHVTQPSATFGDSDQSQEKKTQVYNAFLQSKNDHTRVDRPSTSKSSRTSPPSSVSPISGSFPPMPTTPTSSRNDSGFALSATLREKRSGHFDGTSRRSSSFGVDRHPTLHRPTMTFSNGHQPSYSTSALSIDAKSMYGYAPSSYAASTLAASTIMPNMLMQPIRNTETTSWIEGHCMSWARSDSSSVCSICDERSDGDGMYQCTSCTTCTHGRCIGQISLVCPAAFHPDRVRAAFVRCFSSLFYTYRKYLGRPTKEQKSNGQLYGFDMNGFIRSLPGEQQEYLTMLKQTQAFNEFIHERETTASNAPQIQLFDGIILAKKSRGSRAFFSSKSSKPSFIEDISDHLWRSAAVPSPNSKFPGDYRSVVSRIPAQLDPTLMREPRSIQGAPRIDMPGKRVGRKAVPSMLGIGRD